MRRFYLKRMEDVNGSSGTGIVAEGIEFTDGRVALRWKPGRAGACKTDTVDSIADLEAIHGHGGLTIVDYVDLGHGPTWPVAAPAQS